MPYCSACGATVEEADAFCTECGEPIERAADAPDDAGGRSPDAGGADAGGDGREADAEAPTASADPVAADADPPEADTTTDTTATAVAPDETQPSPTERTVRGRKFAAGGIGLTTIGAFLPWVKVQTFGGTVTKAGIDGDGSITLALAIVAGIALLLGRGKPWTRRSRGLVVVLGLLVALLGTLYLVDPLWGVDASNNAQDLASRGSGLYLTAIGGGLLSGGPLYATFGSDE